MATQNQPPREARVNSRPAPMPSNGSVERRLGGVGMAALEMGRDATILNDATLVMRITGLSRTEVETRRMIKARRRFNSSA